MSARIPHRRPRHQLPPDVEAVLLERGLMDAYRSRPAYQQNDYVGWITEAKRQATREKRLSQMLDELAAGDRYMKMPWRATDQVPVRGGVVASRGNIVGSEDPFPVLGDSEQLASAIRSEGGTARVTTVPNVAHAIVDEPGIAAAPPGPPRDRTSRWRAGDSVGTRRDRPAPLQPATSGSASCRGWDGVSIQRWWASPYPAAVLAASTRRSTRC